MTETELTADYVIVGSGAVGMAFADTLMTESDATLIIIDRYAKPGGHWNVAYPFVQLHQPSSFYGVNSKELGAGRLEVGGLNDGLGELSSGAEVLAYYDDIMRHQFLPSGRVDYYPMCDYVGDGKFISKTNVKSYRVKAKRKFVDATHLNTSVPSTHTPNFEIAADVNFMPLNDLPKLQGSAEGYVVIGAGKTGIDACLWLLDQRVDPEDITWIMSRDSWFINRRNAQTDMSFFFDTMGAAANEFESIAQADTPEDMFDRLEATGYFLRLDPDVRPSMFHGATISHAELEQLQRIKNVVRLGRVSSLGLNEIVLEKGRIPTTPKTVHIDCSASALKDTLENKPVFQGDLITPQMVRPYQPVFSAAMIAHVELNYETEAEKNKICGVVPLPDKDVDYMRFTLAALLNQNTWREYSDLGKWMMENRLSGPGRMLRLIAPEDEEKRAVIQRIRENAPLAAMKLMQFLET